MTKQKTITDIVQLQGVNVFNGKENSITFHPAEDNAGLVFVVDGYDVPATLENAHHVKSLRKTWGASCMGLEGEERSALKVEHLLSAVYMLGIDNVYMELSDRVCPRFEWGVSKVIEGLEDCLKDGSYERSYVTLDQKKDPITISCKEGQDSLIVAKSKGVQFTYKVRYSHASVGAQKMTLRLDLEEYKKKIMYARDIFFLPLGSERIIKALSPFHGVDESSALLIGSENKENYCNPGPYGWTEFIRHKIMDATALLALYGERFKDVHFKHSRTGHGFDIYAWNELDRQNVFVDVE